MSTTLYASAALSSVHQGQIEEWVAEWGIDPTTVCAITFQEGRPDCPALLIFHVYRTRGGNRYLVKRNSGLPHDPPVWPLVDELVDVATRLDARVTITGVPAWWTDLAVEES